MFLLKTKTILKKVWHFLKIYWYVPLLLSWAFIAWLLLRQSSTNMVDVLHSAEKSYRDQIRILNKVHKEEIKKRDAALRRYEQTIKQIEAERKLKNEELLTKEKKLIKQMVEKYKDDPEAYAKEIADRFGFEFVEAE